MKLCPKCHKQFSDDANFCPVDAARLAPLESQSVAADTISAKFDLGDRLGGGRTGAVHRATDKASGQAAALKVISPAVVALPGLAQRLERELKQLERVQSAGVAKVLASGKRGDDTWLALELLDGAQTLAEAIAARGPIPLEQAANLIEVVGEALIEAAQVGVVHRDLAPKNVLFAGDEIKLINFSLPVPGERVAGVAEFVAPEQHDGKPVDQRSNLYSLGALYYFVLTGLPVQHDEGAIKPPSALASVPAGVEAVILRALDKSPTKRFLTVRQFVDEVGRVARGEADASKANGRAKPKAELVQTLLGVRGGFGATAPMPSAPGAAAVVASTLSTQPSAPSTVVGVVVAPMPSGAVTAPVSGGVTAPTASSAVPHGQPTLMGPAMPAPLQPQAIAPERSPWAPPSTLGPQGDPGSPEAREAPVESAVIAPVAPPVVAPPAVAAPVLAAPLLAAPVVAPPVVAAPVVAPPSVAAPVVPAPLLAKPILAGNAGGKKSNKAADKADGKSKGKFRETMWFKKGELDVQAAEAAAAEHAKSGKDGNDKSDLMPIDERYKDDGTLSRSDKEKYSLRTGATMMNMAVRDSGVHSSVGKVSEDALIDEMKGGRNKIFALIAAGLVVLVLIIVMLAR